MALFPKIYCIIKLSELDYHQTFSGGSQRLAKLREAKRIELEQSHLNQQSFIQSLKEEAQRQGLEITFVNQMEVGNLSPGPDDLVISAGGDGTFLNCAQRFSQSILLGMNSDYQPKAGVGSHGALTSINKINLKSRMKDLAQGSYSIAEWSRLQVTINGKVIDRYAVNDIYYGQSISYRTCDILIEQCGDSEEFNCSGILCCTGMGSHAWHYNAGGSPFSNELDAFGFRVLFPNVKRTLKFASGILKKGQEILITPERDGYILSFDSSPEVIETEMGDEIRVSLAEDKAIKVISFSTP